MFRRVSAAVIAGAMTTSAMGAAYAHGGDRHSFSPGSPGIGDPYFPLAGNGGYDVEHYDLDVRYDPATDALRATATIVAEATHDLSQFNLDLDGLEVRSVRVDGRAAAFSRSGGELTIVPRRGIEREDSFEVEVAYDGVPEPVIDILGVSGFLHTDDGALVIGEPQVASTWYPVNDHPLDTATYDFAITVPAGLEAVANGVLTSARTRDGWTTWRWKAREPMAPYLTTMTVGEFDISEYRAGGVRFWDAVDPDLYVPPFTPRSGERAAMSLPGDLAYKRLTRTIDVPVDDTLLTFLAARDTEFGFDYFVVEARTPGGDDWTTLPERSGITTSEPPFACPQWLSDHPFLTHYQTDLGDGSCAMTGSSGAWNGVSGTSDGYEPWTIDLGEWAGSAVEISLTYITDFTVQLPGVVVDDVDAPGTVGDTGFEDDGDTFDGWIPTGAPPGSAGNATEWISGTAADGPPAVGDNVDAAFARQPEIIEFLAGIFGPYPFRSGGGIVDDVEGLGFALEIQTRPIYARDFFGDPDGAASVIVHEYAHQWVGDDLPLALWQHIWLNEGFATYAEWLWSEAQGLGTAEQIFRFYDSVIPEDHPFWTLTIGDPGPNSLFDGAVYIRGAMTLHTLRTTIGDDAFSEVLRTWTQRNSGRNVTTERFVRLAERVSGQQLDDLFESWLFTPTKPEIAPPATLATAARTTALRASTPTPVLAALQLKRLGVDV